jgi:hypothetical protein
VSDDGDDSKRNGLARKNTRLALILGCLALGIYVYFILRFAATR